MKTPRFLAAAALVAAPLVVLAQTNLNPTHKLILTGTNTVTVGKTWFGSSGDTTRGMAFNAATDNLLVADRTPTNAVYVIDADTFADVDTMNITGVTGGTFALNKIGVAADGAIYLANLDTAGATFKIYRWADEATGRVGSGNTGPTVAYDQAVSDSGDTGREGDGFAVFGSGTGTKIVAVGGTTSISLFTTADGTTFTRSTITPSGVTGASQHVTWDPDGTHIWWRTPGITSVLRINTGTSAVTTFTGHTVARGPMAVALVPGGGANERYYLTGVGNSAATGSVPALFYQITDATTGSALPTALYNLNHGAFADSLTSGSASANSNGSGDVFLDTASGRAWQLYTNNSISRYQDGGLPVELDGFTVD